MKLERLPEYATFVVSIALGMLLAIYVGLTTGNGSLQPLIIIGGCLAVAGALILKQNIWLLIPICGSLTARTFGTAFGINNFVIIYVFVVFLSLRALKIVRGKPTYTWIDYLLFINLAYIATVYIRNPVGTLAMGSNRLGGRPYVDVGFGLLTYYVLSYITVSPKLALKLPFLMVLGDVFNTFAGAVARMLPSVGQPLSHIYGAFLPKLATDPSGAVETSEINREIFLGQGGMGMFNTLCSYFPPLSLLNPMRIVRFTLTCLTLLAILKSGFRSYFFSALLFFSFVTYFRNGIITAIRIPAVLIPILGLVILGQGTLFNLPLNIQRALSFLPGHWSYVAKQDAQASTQWRIEIWSNVWNSGHKYINNWWFGDGWGLTREQLKENLASKDMQESLTIAGDYHSLPLSTIHIVGYVGLVLLVILLIGMAIYAWKLICRAKGTPFFPLTLLIAVPAVYALFTGMLIFGAYAISITSSITIIAWMRLINRSLDAYFASQREKTENRANLSFPDLDVQPRFNL